MDETRTGGRQLTVFAVVLIGLSALTDAQVVWPVAILAAAAVMLGALQLLGEGSDIGVPIESLLTTGAVVLAGIGAVRVVPLGPLVLVVLIGAAVLMGRALALELRLVGGSGEPSEDDRVELLWLTVALAAVGFAGFDALVGGVPRAALIQGGAAAQMPVGLPVLAAANATLSAMLGYRLAALRRPVLRHATWAALTFAVLIGGASLVLRWLIPLPGLVGPAVLTLIFYLWHTFVGAPSAARRTIHWVWELGLLGVLGAGVVGWYVLVRG